MPKKYIQPIEAFEVLDTLTTDEGRYIYADYYIRRKIKERGLMLRMIRSADIARVASLLVYNWRHQQ